MECTLAQWACKFSQTGKFANCAPEIKIHVNFACPVLGNKQTSTPTYFYAID